MLILLLTPNRLRERQIYMKKQDSDKNSKNIFSAKRQDTVITLSISSFQLSAPNGAVGWGRQHKPKISSRADQVVLLDKHIGVCRLCDRELAGLTSICRPKKTVVEEEDPWIGFGATVPCFLQSLFPLLELEFQLSNYPGHRNIIITQFLNLSLRSLEIHFHPLKMASFNHLPGSSVLLHALCICLLATCTWRIGATNSIFAFYLACL